MAEGNDSDSEELYRLLQLALKLRENKSKVNREIEKREKKSTPKDTFIEQRLATAISNFKGVQKMPDCFEKTYFSLLYYACLQKYNQEDKINNELNIDKKFEEYLAKLPKQAEDEMIQDKALLQMLKVIASSEKIDQIIEQLIQTNNQIKLFSFYEFFSLRDEVDKSAEKIRDKDIVLLLGSTGSGKSTTVHYFAGSKLKFVWQEGKPHFEVEKIIDEDLRKVVTSCSSKSETRFVTPVTIVHNMRKIIIADTPGSQDTQSSEIEFSNMLGVKNAISKANSIRPVILFSYKNLGDRMEHLKELMYYYGQLFNKIQSYVKQFTYIFTKVTETSKGTALPYLLDIQKNLNKDEQEEEILNIMLNDLTIKAQKGQIIELEPLNLDERESILDQIMMVKPIKNPDEVIRPKVSPKSYEVLKGQLALHKQAIMQALKLCRGDIMSFKLEELKKFSDTFSDDEAYSDHYKECLSMIQNFINEKFEISTKVMSQRFRVKNELNIEHVECFFKEYSQMKQLDECNSIFFRDTPTKSSVDYLTFLNEIITTVLSDLEYSQAKLNDKAWFDFFKKMILFKDFEKLKITYIDVIDNFMIDVENKCDYCKQFIIPSDQTPMGMSQPKKKKLLYERAFELQKSLLDQEFSMTKRKPSQSIISCTSFSDDQQIQFETFALLWSEIYRCQKKMAKINSDYSKYIAGLSDEIHQQFSQFLTVMIQKNFEKFFDQVNPLELSKEEIKKAELVIDNLNNFKYAFELNQLTNCEIFIDKQILILQSQLERNLEQQIHYIEDFMKTIDKPQVLEIMFKNVKLMKELPILKTPNIESKFISLISSLSNYVRRQDEVIGNLFNSIQDRSKRDYIHLNKLKISLKFLNQLKWFEQQGHQSYQSYKQTIENIEEKFTLYTEQLENELRNKKFDMKNIANLKLLAKAQSEIKEYQAILDNAKISINLQDIIGFQLKLKSINLTIDENEKLVAQYEEFDKPLQTYQLKFLDDFSNYIQVLIENNRIFPDQIKYESILNRIEGENSLTSKQQKLIIDKLYDFVHFIDNYCQQIDKYSHTDISSNLDQLRTILQTVKDLKKSQVYQNILEKIDRQQNLEHNINVYINRILSFFRDIYVKFEKNSLEFRSCYEILSRITFIDQFSEKKEFDSEFENWRKGLEINSIENIENLKKLFIDMNCYDINIKLKEIELSKNQNELKKIVNAVRDQILQNLQLLQKIIIFDSIDIQTTMQPIINAAAMLQQIVNHIDKKYQTNIDIVQQLSLFKQRLLSQINEYLDRSTLFFKCDDFASSFKCIKIAKQINESLNGSEVIGQNELSDLQTKILAQQQTIQDEIKSKIEEYENLQPSQFSKQPPIYLFENIKQIQDQDIMLSFQIKLKQNVMVNLLKQTQDIQNQLNEEKSDLGEIDKKLAKLQMLKNVLPEQWWQELSIQILQNNIDTRIKDEEKILEQLENRNDIGMLLNLLDKKKNLLKNDKFINLLNSNFKKIITKCSQSIKFDESLVYGITEFIDIENYLKHHIAADHLDKINISEFSKLSCKIIQLIQECTQDVIQLFKIKAQLQHILKPHQMQQNSQQANQNDVSSNYQIQLSKLAFFIHAIPISEVQELKQDEQCDTKYQQFQNILKRKVDEINNNAQKYIQKLETRVKSHTYSKIIIVKFTIIIEKRSYKNSSCRIIFQTYAENLNQNFEKSRVHGQKISLDKVRAAFFNNQDDYCSPQDCLSLLLILIILSVLNCL